MFRGSRRAVWVARGQGSRRPQGSRGGKPHRRERKPELDGTGCCVATGDRKGREGASPIGANGSRNLTARDVAWLPATARVARGQAPRLHIYALYLEKCVVDGFT